MDVTLEDHRSSFFSKTIFKALLQTPYVLIYCLYLKKHYHNSKKQCTTFSKLIQSGTINILPQQHLIPHQPFLQLIVGQYNFQIARFLLFCKIPMSRLTLFICKNFATESKAAVILCRCGLGPKKFVSLLLR